MKNNSEFNHQPKVDDRPVCNCPCHSHPGMMHIMACCGNPPMMFQPPRISVNE